jgi:DNA-directed RNA polymerase subunit RPC12/RpoP
MVESPYASWNSMALNLSYICWAAGILVVLGYLVRFSTVPDAKDKYDFINKHEVNFLWYASLIIILGACFFFNANIVELTTVLIFVRVFLTAMLGTIAALIVQNLLKFYYPFFIEKRLKVLRYKPRISPKTGKPMKLLSEEEEDVHLDEGMQAEENLYSVDYDVWKDEETGFIKIEKYAGHLHAIQCPECNYQTFKVMREEIVKQPSETEEGELIKHYQCSYCGYKARKNVVLKQQVKSPEAATATTA